MIQNDKHFGEDAHICRRALRRWNGLRLEPHRAPFYHLWWPTGPFATGYQPNAARFFRFGGNRNIPEGFCSGVGAAEIGALRLAWGRTGERRSSASGGAAPSTCKRATCGRAENPCGIWLSGLQRSLHSTLLRQAETPTRPAFYPVTHPAQVVGQPSLPAPRACGPELHKTRMDSTDVICNDLRSAFHAFSRPLPGNRLARGSNKKAA
jgi:hypothetical protein